MNHQGWTPGTANAAGRTSSSTASATPGRRNNVRNAYGACDWPSPRRRVGPIWKVRDVRVRCSFHHVFCVFLCFSMSSHFFSQTHFWFSHEIHIIHTFAQWLIAPFWWVVGAWLLGRSSMVHILRRMHGVKGPSIMKRQGWRTWPSLRMRMFSQTAQKRQFELMQLYKALKFFYVQLNSGVFPTNLTCF